MLVKPTAQSVPNTGAHRTDTFKPLYKKTQCLLDRVFRDRFRNVCGDECWAVANKGQCAVGQIRHSRLPAAELNVVPPRGARGQAEVSEDPDNDRGIRDGGDDFQAAAAVWTVLNGDLEDALEQARPTDAGWRRAVCSVSVIIARVTGVAIRPARVAQYAIVAFVVLIALDQMGVGGAIVRESFLIILAGVVFALALAFGLGGRDWAAGLLERWWPRRRRDDER